MTTARKRRPASASASASVAAAGASPASTANPATTSASGATAGRLGDQLCFALYAATNAVTRMYRPLLDALGLTYPQYLVLLVLWEHRSRRLGEIADELRLATHAVSPIVDRMEEAGLVRREKDAVDGRVVHVVLTDAGAALESSAAAVQEQLRCRTMLEPAEVTRLRAQLVTLADRMREP